jgi:signal recognition particle subunit SRP54
MIPGLGKLKKLKDAKANPKVMTKITAIIDSMTLEERRNHTIICPSRRKRIAKGSGTTVADVNQLVKNFTETLKQLKQATRAGGLDALRRNILGANFKDINKRN